MDFFFGALLHACKNLSFKFLCVCVRFEGNDEK